ncbi:MAG TPA: hypothetical protein VH724_19545, partial [Candidatus Angelobacter sp.]|nr:hypothetical protein [Candidatus Angelobacter sp.]
VRANSAQIRIPTVGDVACRAFGRMAFFLVEPECRVDLLRPFICRELAANRETLPAYRTAPGDGIPIDLFYDH